ncbi:cytochrome C [Massilia sp. R2A-15]|uniref:cytochrome C n=1 Tax=Massilia sp. R2A-15 TaxID=3064278 RepID=UPI002734A206|nr:cytochrome C [Massilia sp. R2A-15]WLI91618.1 cytochrome C [Massilia sp. R2A-15]
MTTPGTSTLRNLAQRIGFALLLLQALLSSAHAMPVFARQTGQQCATCHAGGQFPELTPFGRTFKLTGYTLGQRAAVPVALMAVASFTSTKNTVSEQPSVDFAKDAVALFQTGSVLFGGKITDKLGLFAQVTYDNYASQDPVTLKWKGHSHADNIDLRYATRWSRGGHDWVGGITLNNNPTVSDLWNTAPAWIQYVPTGFGFTGPAAQPIVAQLGQQVAGLGAYTLWADTVYAELAGYQTTRGPLSILAEGNPVETRLRGTSPYYRVALTHDWGRHNAMIGLFGLHADVYQDPAISAGPTTRYRDTGIDAQYQYLGEMHTATAQLSYVRERIRGGDLAGIASNASDTLRQLRMKGSYIYRAKLGAGLTFFNTSGSADDTLYPGLQDDGAGNLTPIAINGSRTNRPDTRGWIPEVFWTPEQHVRIGAQYFRFTRYNGASTNYDGAGRNAAGNNTLFVYLWAAY